MMKQDYFPVTFLSTLLIALYILGSINTVSGLKLNCYVCDKCETPANSQECEEDGEICLTETETNGAGTVSAPTRSCEKHTGNMGCVREMDLTGRFEFHKCFCNHTDNCNSGKGGEDTSPGAGGNGPATTKTTNKPEAGAAVRLSQMSVWILFAFPVAVTWMSGGAVLGHRHL